MSPFRFQRFAWMLVYVISAQAHPGHDLMEHGADHLVSSPYHLTVLSVSTLFCFGLGALVTKPEAKRALNRAGFIALLSTVALWVSVH